jgi:23S rRNA pseudouridine2457 synthase
MRKTYWVQVEHIPTELDLKKIRDGIYIKDHHCLPAQVNIIDEPNIWPRVPPIRERKSIPTCWLELTICEGKNRQVRRMTAAMGFPTLRLIRVKIGPWQLDHLQPGEYVKAT